MATRSYITRLPGVDGGDVHRPDAPVVDPKHHLHGPEEARPDGVPRAQEEILGALGKHRLRTCDRVRVPPGVHEHPHAHGFYGNSREPRGDRDAVAHDVRHNCAGVLLALLQQGQHQLVADPQEPFVK